MIRRPAYILLTLLICLLTTQFAVGQTTRPTTDPTAAVADQDLGNQLIGGAPRSKSAPGIGIGTVAGTSAALDMVRIAIALAIVIGAILILRVVVQNIGNLPGGRRSGKLVSVLSRSIISPKQQVLVLQVGKRLIVVGDSGGHMNALCEISDPDEIAELVGQTRQDHQSRSDRNSGSFGNLFRRANEPFSEGELAQSAPDEGVQNIDSVDGVTSEDVSGLLDKVRMLQQQFKH